MPGCELPQGSFPDPVPHLFPGRDGPGSAHHPDIQVGQGEQGAVQSGNGLVTEGLAPETGEIPLEFPSKVGRGEVAGIPAEELVGPLPGQDPFVAKLPGRSGDQELGHCNGHIGGIRVGDDREHGIQRFGNIAFCQLHEAAGEIHQVRCPTGMGEVVRSGKAHRKAGPAGKEGHEGGIDSSGEGADSLITSQPDCGENGLLKPGLRCIDPDPADHLPVADHDPGFDVPRNNSVEVPGGAPVPGEKEFAAEPADLLGMAGQDLLKFRESKPPAPELYPAPEVYLHGPPLEFISLTAGTSSLIPFVDAPRSFIALPIKPPGMVRMVAVDLGATNTRAAVLDQGGRITDKEEVRTPAGGADPAILPRFLSGLITKVCGSPLPDDIAGIGLSVAGPVDIRRGILLNPPNMTFRDVPVTAPLSERFGIPVRMVNDCHAGIVGEISYGAAKGRRNAVYITISTGIGAGVLANGRILLGRDGNAAEVGHFHVDDTYNLVCGCGHSGHWEGYASGRYLPWFFAQWCHYHGKPHWGPDAAEDIFRSARQGDDDVLRFLEELSRINARAVSDIVVAYDPELIIFDGSVLRSNADLLLGPMIDAVDRYLRLPELAMTNLDGDAPLLGAGVIARGYDTEYGDFAAMIAE